EVQAEGRRRAGRLRDAAQERGREGLRVHGGAEGGRPQDRDRVHERPLQGRRVRPELLPERVEGGPGEIAQNSFFFIIFSISSTSRGAAAESRSKPSFVMR